MKSFLSDLLRRLGVDSLGAADVTGGAEQRIELYLDRPEAARLLVGRLWKEGDLFFFQYSRDFEQSGLPTLPDFPHRESSERYESAYLWPFFTARLPPTDRPDVRQLLEKRHVEARDTLGVLGALSHRSVSSPYELELKHA